MISNACITNTVKINFQAAVWIYKKLKA